MRKGSEMLLGHPGTGYFPWALAKASSTLGENLGGEEVPAALKVTKGPESAREGAQRHAQRSQHPFCLCRSTRTMLGALASLRPLQSRDN